MGVWQWIWVCLVAINLLLVANKHGQPNGKYNFWVTLFSTVLNFIILYFGGFFK